MRPVIRIASIISFAAVIAAPLPCSATAALFWTHTYPYGGGGTAIGKAVDVDQFGNTVIAGNIAGNVDLGGGMLAGSNDWDIFVAKYSPSGEHIWSQRFGESLPQSVAGLVVNAFGDIIVKGEFEGTFGFGGEPLTSAGAEDIYVASLSPDGNLIWSNRFGDSMTQRSRCVAVDAAGNVYIGGNFYGTVNFGGSNLTSAGENDIFLAGFSRFGMHRWSQRFGDSNSGQWAQGVATNQLGDVVIVGSMTGAFSFGGSILIGGSSNDMYVALFNSNGSHQWSKRFSGAGSGWASAVACGSSDNVLMAGFYGAALDFGGGVLPPGLFLANFSATGVHEWSRSYDGSATARSLARDSANNIVLTGEGPVDLGGGTLIVSGQQTFFVGKLDPLGNHIWSEALAGRSSSEANFAAPDDRDNIVLAGWYHGNAEQGAELLANPTGDDVFVAKLGSEPATPAISSVLDIGNDQGRQVRVRFSRSGFDEPNPSATVLQYEVFRRVDPLPATTLTSAVLPPVGDWEFVGAVPAHHDTDYRIVVPTLADSSIVNGPYYTSFFVRAATADPGEFFDSVADSGYSIDNLAPGLPGNLVYSTSGVLAWNESSAADFDYFTVYGASADDFGSATVIDYTTVTSLDVAASPYAYFFVTATDFAGNEGDPAKVKTASGVGDTPRRYILSVSNFPNPFNPHTTVSYSVPASGRVTLAIYDARGARVATLLDAKEQGSGAHRLEWHGRADGGAILPSGVYFARIEHEGQVHSTKMVLVR